jgi:ATP-dependent protease ClpP protease subunit
VDGPEPKRQRKPPNMDQCVEAQSFPLPTDGQLLFEPNLSINGQISSDTLAFVLGRLAQVRADGVDLLVELNTQGGDADVARRIALEVRLFQRHSGRNAFCVGKTSVYSAGVTILAAFERENRYLTDDTVLLVHERRLDESIQLTGPIRSCLQIVREQLQLLETARELEMEGFRELVEGSALSLEDIYEQAKTNCYLTAREAEEAGLIGGILT